MSTAGQIEFVIGNYKVSKTIGEGTFGKVRLGIHIPTGEKVAVKTLQKQKIAEQADIERVTREICILKILRHPNIVQLYEIIQTKTDIHLIMEYASGGELFDYIVKRKRLDEQEAISFMQQILSGVEYIHKNGIVHRDLKPENLLFDEHRRIKIVDFGLSNQYKSGERLKTACGSPCYAAPQMIAGKRYECVNIDIWSCGIILYAMLCGYLPFQDANTNKLYKKIMAGQYEQPKVLTADSKQMLKCILNVNPEARYKISQIKQSKWYNMTGKKYEVPGIIVGTDTIVPDQRVIAAMKRMGVTAEIAQIKNYIINNRHNHVTAFYYLLKKKAENYPSILTSEAKGENDQKRSSSPLIYKPDTKKQFFIPSKKPGTAESKDSTKVNDSFNASSIVSSLVEANKNKLIGNVNPQNKLAKKIENFDKYEEFKLFPKHKNSSQYEPQSPTSPMVLPINPNPTLKPQSLTSRSDADDKRFTFLASKIHQKEKIGFKPDSMTQINNIKPEQKVSSQPVAVSQQKIQLPDRNEAKIAEKQEVQTSKNKRREQLSDQLKQISIKIDKEIVQLRKHNTIGSATGQKRRQSFGYPLQVPTLKFKTPSAKTERPESSLQMSNNLNTQLPTNSQAIQKQRIDTQPVESKLNQYKEIPTRFPKMHFGPFNAQCLLMEAPRTILVKIQEYLSKLQIIFKETDLFTLRLQTNQMISVESIHGISGYHLVKFTNNTPLSESILQFLSQ